MLGIALFHGFSKMLIALGLEPSEMETTVVPTPTPGGIDIGATEPDPHLDLLSDRPDLASRWAHMATTLVAVAPEHADIIDAVRARLARLIGVAWAAETTSAPGTVVDPTAMEMAELFAIDVRAITPQHRDRLGRTLGETGLVQVVMALAVYDGIYRVAATRGDSASAPRG